MSVYEYVAIGTTRPTFVRKESPAEVVNALEVILQTSTGLPVLMTYTRREPPRARVERWHQVMQWLREPHSRRPKHLMILNWSSTGALEEKLRSLTENTLVLLAPRVEVEETIRSHKDVFETWARTLDERVRHAEAAETALWTDVVDEMIEPVATDDRVATDAAEAEAAAFQRAVLRRDWLMAKEAWLTSDAIAKRARGAVVESNANQYAYQLRQTGQILGVRHLRQRRHPACQFHTVDGRLEPLPVMRPLLELLPKDDSGWTQAFWLFQPTGRLEGARPADLLAVRPDDVLLAAKKDFHGDDGI